MRRREGRRERKEAGGLTTLGDDIDLERTPVSGVSGERCLCAVDVAVTTANAKITDGITRPAFLERRQQVVQNPVCLQRNRFVLENNRKIGEENDDNDGDGDDGDDGDDDDDDEKNMLVNDLVGSGPYVISGEHVLPLRGLVSLLGDL